MMNLARQMYAAMDGILCTTDDPGGRRVSRSAFASGIAVPQELAIAGFAARRIGQIVTPAAGKRPDPAL